MPENEITKVCSLCKNIKPIHEFTVDKTRKDGHCYLCKFCTSVRTSTYRNSEHGKIIRKIGAKRYLATERGKEIQRKNNRIRDLRHPEFRIAKEAIHNAVRKGRLPRIDTLSCLHCGKQAKERHHHNGYSKEHILDTIPLCIQCHKKAHKSPATEWVAL